MPRNLQALLKEMRVGLSVWVLVGRLNEVCLSMNSWVFTEEVAVLMTEAQDSSTAV